MLLAACAIPPAPPPRQLPVEVSPSPLAGTSWLLAVLNGQSPVEGTSITLNFERLGRASGSDGCNDYSTSYAVAGSQLTFGPIAGTMMACPDPVMQQATAYQQALAQTASYVIEGERLTLMNSGGAALATFDPQRAELAGTSWDVLSYNNGKEAVVSVIIGTKLTATFDADGRLSGNAGCNDYSGDYATEGEKITIGPLAATQKYCDQPAGVMEQEAQYLAALQSAATYRVDGNTMEMRTADGALAAVFQRAAYT